MAIEVGDLINERMHQVRALRWCKCIFMVRCFGMTDGGGLHQEDTKNYNNKDKVERFSTNCFIEYGLVICKSAFDKKYRFANQKLTVILQLFSEKPSIVGYANRYLLEQYQHNLHPCI
jgi:hypothetical protein